MRFKMELELKNGYLPLDYRPSVISLFKHSLTEYDNGKHFSTYYEVGKDKPFTFAVGIPSSRFTKEKVLVPNRKINITFSTGDMKTGIVFFNALSMQKNKPYPLAFENEMIMKNILIEKEVVITTDTIDIIFKAPLCVREHNRENNKDIYYSYEKEGFYLTFNKVLKFQIANSNTLPQSIVEGFSIMPLNCKKTVVRHHSQFLEVTIGMFSLTGNIALLSYLYTNGIGSRTSAGFGMFEIMRKETL
ncbi:CRISPR-associated endoribonuclease Cas6 [Clostridium estertheticum]|uniref:CRISPR-associated endoribonuclease Cas6 n=1 Tax=Clostridium estertheticum TaxID=238834 RepID=UPI001C7CF666|nr:CRISPR-associated endoribonuclease Cas6 [Clostridium estertheticum]MBX4262157.1 CRISPR-associated endoribonuclease Cas6 [Clostridium estertheticum]WLC69026.1 CRISPR-associated endoribonuclease Cas6 [Clostridium estertheticum]